MLFMLLRQPCLCTTASIHPKIYVFDFVVDDIKPELFFYIDMIRGGGQAPCVRYKKPNLAFFNYIKGP